MVFTYNKCTPIMQSVGRAIEGNSNAILGYVLRFERSGLLRMVEFEPHGQVDINGICLGPGIVKVDWVGAFLSGEIGLLTGSEEAGTEKKAFTSALSVAFHTGGDN